MCPLLQRSAEASGPSSPECTPTGPQGRGSEAQRREHRVRSLPSCGRGHAPSDRSPWPSKTTHVPPQPVPIIGVSVRWDLEFGCRAVTDRGTFLKGTGSHCRFPRGSSPLSFSFPPQHTLTHSQHAHSHLFIHYAQICSLMLAHSHTHTCSHSHAHSHSVHAHMFTLAHSHSGAEITL